MFNNLSLTRREKIVLIIFAAFLPIPAIVPQDVINRYELAFLVFVVIPVVIMLVTDPQRRNK